MASTTATEYRFPIRVVNLRRGGGNALAFFNLEFCVPGKDGALVPVMVAKDFVLKRSNADALYFQGPSKPRMRNGEQQIDDKGFKIYDALVDLYGEKGASPQDPTKWSPTKAAFALRKQIIADAEAAMAAFVAEAGGRGSKPADAGDAVDGDATTTPYGAAEDDELPF